jgi:hypothetical protein
MEVMMRMFSKKIISIPLILLYLGFAWGCGGGGGDSPAETVAGDDTPVLADMTGTWQVEETVNGNCSDTDYPYTQIRIYTGTQTGNSVTFYDSLEDEEMTATLNGYTLKLNGTRRNGDGTLSINGTATCAEDGRSFSGTSQWTYNEPGYSCSGTTQANATKTSDQQMNASGRWSGTYESKEYHQTGTFSVVITDTDGDLTGTIDVPSIGMIDTELTGRVDGNAITFGDINGEIIFSGVMAQSDTASGSYEYDALNDEGSWEAGRI